MHRAWIWLAACLLLLSVAADAETIAEVKSSPNWLQVTVEGIVTYTEPDECYIEAPDRSGGIWVLGPMDTVSVGDPVVALGTFSVVMGEPAITDASVYLQHALPTTIRPFGMSNRGLGGASKFSPLWIWDYILRKVEVADEPVDQGWAWQRFWTPASGANNVGLLVTTSGTIKSICESPIDGTKWLYIDDGSGLTADFGDLGVLVYTDAEVQMGDRVTVTGVSSTEPSMDEPTRLVRVIRTRDADDLQVVAPPEGPVYPFSDEFDSPTLDPRWLVLAEGGSISTTTEPGWLTLTISPVANQTAVVPQLVQQACGDWEFETKVRAGWHASYTNQPIVLIGLKMDHNFKNASGGSAFGFAAIVPNCESGECRNQVWLVWNGVSHCVPVDTYYFRFRRQDGLVYSSVSFDGLTYQGGETGENAVGDFIVFTFSNQSKSLIPLTYYVDYIRFTPIAQGGGQK